MKNEIDKTVERIKQRGDDHKLYCPTCKAGRNCMDHLMIRENDLQEQVTQLKADLATERQRFYKELLAIYDGDCVGDSLTAFENWFENEFNVEVCADAVAIGKEWSFPTSP